MASKASGAPAAPASAAVERLRQLLAARAVIVGAHIAAQVALTADDRKWRLSEVVSHAYADDTPEDRLNAVLEVLTDADPELAAVRLAAQRVKPSAPVIPGPGTDAPGHPDWCVDHEAEHGDGTSTCFGAETSVGDSRARLSQTTGEAAGVWLYLGDRDEGENLSADEARGYARELRQVADLLEALADQADAGSAVAA